MHAFNIGLRWTARIWSIASTLFILPFLTSGGVPTANELVALAFFPTGVIVGFAIAWWREFLGGLITVISLIGFYASVFQRDGVRWIGPYFLLLSAPGLLFIASAILNNRSGRISSNSPPT